VIFAIDIKKTARRSPATIIPDSDLESGGSGAAAVV